MSQREVCACDLCLYAQPDAPVFCAFCTKIGCEHVMAMTRANAADDLDAFLEAAKKLELLRTSEVTAAANRMKGTRYYRH